MTKVGEVIVKGSNKSLTFIDLWHGLDDCGTSWLSNLLGSSLIFVSWQVLDRAHQRLNWITKKRKIIASQSISRFELLYMPKISWIKKWVCLFKTLLNFQKCILLMFMPAFHKETYTAFHWVNMHQGKGNNQTSETTGLTIGNNTNSRSKTLLWSTSK